MARNGENDRQFFPHSLAGVRMFLRLVSLSVFHVFTSLESRRSSSEEASELVFVPAHLVLCGVLRPRVLCRRAALSLAR